MSTPRIPKAKTLKPVTITDLLERDKQLMLRSTAKKKILLNLKLREYEQVIEIAEKWDCTVSEALRSLLVKGIEHNKKWGSESELNPANEGKWVPQQTYVDPVTQRAHMPTVFNPNPLHFPTPHVQHQVSAGTTYSSGDRIQRTVETVFDDAPRKRGSTLTFPSGATINPPAPTYVEPPQDDILEDYDE
jgi:hypothetical protein